MAAAVELLALRGFQATTAEEISRRAGVSKGLLWHYFDDIDQLFEATAERMGLPMERVMMVIQKYGNTTSATIPLCLWDYETRLKSGDRLILAAFGGGFTWAGAYVTWAYDTAAAQS